jgi:hypothetical protein
VLSNRELVSLSVAAAFLVLVAVVAYFHRDVRDSLRRVALAFLKPKVAVSFAAYLAWMGAVVLGAYWVGLWRTDFLGETLTWLLASGLPLMLRLPDARKPGFVRREVVRIVSLAVFLEVYLNLCVLDLPWEVVLQLGVGVLALALVMASNFSELHRYQASLERTLTVVGLGLIAGTAVCLVIGWSTMDPTAVALGFALPVWLGVLALAYTYTLSRVTHALGI